jgi:hypothetical protein
MVGLELPEFLGKMIEEKADMTVEPEPVAAEEPLDETTEDAA